MHWANAVSASIVVCLGVSAARAVGDVSYHVTANTSSISGQTGWLDMQFNPGGMPPIAGTASVTHFATDGVLSPATIQRTGDCTGDAGPPTRSVQLANGTGLNDYFESITFGNSLSFDLTLAGNIFSPPSGTLYGSSFSLGFLDNGISVPLLSDPGESSGAAAVVDVLFDGSVDLRPITPAVTFSPVPEPASLLGIAGVAGTLVVRRRRRGL